jgi:V8-like Glu-specific endopeptidase
MRNMKPLTICLLVLSSILTIGLDASAQLDPNMEAGVDCVDANCMFRGNSQTHDAVAGFQKLPTNGGEAKLYKVNRFEDNMGSTVDRKVDTQFSAIGELESNATMKDAKGNDLHYYGSAVLISPCYIITNHHVAFGDDADPIPGKDYSMKFRVGTSPNAAFEGNTVATPVKWGNIGMCGSSDWAIMKLKTCVGGRPEYGWMESSRLKTADLLKNSTTVAVAGFAGDHQRGELSIGIGKVKGYDKPGNMLKYSAPMSSGMSGGAVIVIEDGIMKLAGINAVELHDVSNPKNVFSKYSEEHANEFLSVSEILNRSDIKEMLDQDKASVGLNPALVRFSRPLPSAPSNASI